MILVEFRPEISMSRCHAMAAGPSIDVSGWLEEQLAQASPDLLRAMVADVRRSADGRRGRRGLRRRLGRAQRAADEYPQRLPAPGLGHPGRDASTWRSRSCGRAAISRTGCWSDAAGPRRRWSRWWRRPICWASRPGGWRSWSRRSGSPGCPSRRSRDGRGPRRAGRGRSAPGRWTPGPYTFVAADALVLKVREGGRTVNVHALLARA